jgi:signal transduction histidine kinase
MRIAAQNKQKGLMSTRMFAAGCALFLSGWVGPGRASAGQPPALGELRTFSQYWSVPPEEALKGRPVRFQCVVLCYDADWGQLYVHDGSETMYFSPRSFPMPLESGQQVEITGTTAFVAGSSALTNLHLVVAGRAALPRATPLELRDLAKDFGQWVETSGEVRVAQASSARLALVIHDRGQSCVVFVMGPLAADASFKQWVGSRIRVRGINASKLSKGRLESASITAPGSNEVHVLEPSALAPERVPVVSIDSLLNRELGAWTNQMVHINGSIAAYKPGEFLEVKDPTGLIRVQVIQTTLAKQDEWVDAWGFLEVAPEQTLLRDGFFEQVRLRKQRAAATSVAGVTAGVASTNQTLTRIRDVISLSKEEAGRGIPVRLQGVITFADADWQNTFLQGRTNAVYVDVIPDTYLKQGDVRAGQWVEVTGQTGTGGYKPEVDNATIRVLGTTNLPFPVKVDLGDLAEGHLDAHFVELAGVVRRVQEESGHLTLTLTTPLGRFKAVIPVPGNQPPPAQLVDALVRVRGACSSELNARGQFSGVFLHVPGLDQIQIEQPAPSNPFAIRSIPIGRVGTFDPDRLAGRRVKVSGVVTLTTRGQGFFLQDASGGMRVSTQETNQPQVGDALEVLGFPALDEFAPRLEEAAFRWMGPGHLPPAQQTTAEQIMLEGTNNGAVVQLEARLLHDVPRSASPRLVLQDGSVIFTARLAGQNARAPLPQWRAGSVLRLAGVCSIQGAETHQPAGFRLLLAQPGDVILLRAPSWWTVRHALLLSGGLTLSILAAAGWIGLLRRQVRAQTDIIRRDHEQLAEASRQAGKAEVATSVLHNVGNVLNSVNISAGLITGLVRASRARDIAKVSALLEEHRADLAEFLTRQDRAEPLLAYLKALTQQVESEQTTMLREAQELTQNIDHIKQIVAMQQTYAKVSGVVDFQSVPALLEDALRMNAAALVRHRVSVVRQFDPLPDMLLDKHKVMQILVNLISNAKYALAGSAAEPRRLTLGAHLNGDNLLRISVADNGIGIASENLTRIFSHGFTTRRDGHGFGLHSGALAAREMGGLLRAESEGPGQGATFTLELPAQPKKPLA